MDLQQYIATKKAPRKIPADIQNRWDNRIVENGFHLLGEGCFQAYEAVGWANHIGADKCLAFAWCALTAGFPAAANSFFRKAAELEGIPLSDAGNTAGAGAATPDIARAPAPQPQVHNVAFPADRQPGRFNPMQPEDAQRDRSHYIQDDFYWGQPKIDGNKLIVFVTPSQIVCQSREGNLRKCPSGDMETSLMSVSQLMGNFVLEGELVYFDANGKEWMTAAEATKSNQKIGEPGRLPTMAYVVFLCNWRTNDPLETYGEMVELGARIAEMCKSAGSTVIRPIYMARTRAEKEQLAYQQQAQGREGEVWFLSSIPYTPGKNAEDALVRTKYTKALAVRVTGYIPSTAAGFAFAALTVQTLDGLDLGKISSGFTLQERELIKRYLDLYGPFEVPITTQGFTSDGKARHARLDRKAWDEDYYQILRSFVQ